MNYDDMAILRGYARRGLGEKEIARKLGMKLHEFRRLKNDGPEIAEALRQTPEFVEIMLEDALIRRAAGYTVAETRTETTEKGGEKTVTTEKEVPPDVSALKFYLQSRNPDRWGKSSPADPDSDDGDGYGVIMLQ